MVEFKEVLVTPKIAMEYISRNSHNRILKKEKVAMYAKDMLDGKWKRNTAEPIKIATSGRVLDGNHRLHAIVKAELSVHLIIATGLKEDVFDVLDTGTSRTNGDTFDIAGIKNARLVPAIIQLYSRLNNGNLRKSASSSTKLTNADTLDIYLERPSFWQSVASRSVTGYGEISRFLSPAIIGGTYSHFYDIDPDDAKMFIDQLCSGNDISNSTIKVLRKKLQDDKVRIHKLPYNIKMAFIIKTWNAFRLNKSLQVLKFDVVTEEYPEAM